MLWQEDIKRVEKRKVILCSRIPIHHSLWYFLLNTILCHSLGHLLGQTHYSLILQLMATESWSQYTATSTVIEIQAAGDKRLSLHFSTSPACLYRVFSWMQ